MKGGQIDPPPEKTTLKKPTLIRVNSSVTPKLIQKVTADLDFLKTSDTDCIPAVVLKNFESELSHILAELFNMYLNESCFSDFLKVPSVVHLFQNIGGRDLLLKSAKLLFVSMWPLKPLKNL